MYRSAAHIRAEMAEQDFNNNLAKFGSQRGRITNLNRITAIRSVKGPDFFLNTNRKPSPAVRRRRLTQLQASPKKTMMELRQEKIHFNQNQEVKPNPDPVYSITTTESKRDKMKELEEEFSNLLMQNEQPLYKYNLEKVLNMTRKQQIPTSVDWKGWRVPQPLDVVATRDRRQPLPGSLVQTDKCCCQRPTHTVYCLACGFHVHGNVKRMCPVHPKHIFLLDLECCGNRKCRSPCHLLERD